MSRSVGIILGDIQDEVNEHGNEMYASIIRRAIARAYRAVHGEHIWRMTRKLFEPADALTSSSAQPILLPADFKRPISVRDDNYTYYQDNTRGKFPKHPYNWYYGEATTSVLQSGLRCSVGKDSASVEFDFDGDLAGLTALDADVAGEWIQIGSNEDLYLISTRDSDTTLTLSQSFRSVDDAAGVPFTIRPTGMDRIYLVDSARTAASPSSLVIEYQAKPLSIVADTDILQLPDEACQAVFWKALQFTKRRKGWSRQAQNDESDYRHALALAKREDPVRKDDRLMPKQMFMRPRNQSILRSITDAGS